MTLRIAATALAASLVGAIGATSASAQVPCGPRAPMLKMFAERHQEVPISMGLSGGKMLEVFGTVDGSTWTITITDTAGKLCVMAAGTFWERLKPQPGDTDAKPQSYKPSAFKPIDGHIKPTTKSHGGGGAKGQGWPNDIREGIINIAHEKPDPRVTGRYRWACLKRAEAETIRDAARASTRAALGPINEAWERVTDGEVCIFDTSGMNMTFLEKLESWVDFTGASELWSVMLTDDQGDSYIGFTIVDGD